ncbi:hypothetical protein [Actomonas aquatica]|uniref:Heparin-sulfate lyase N-terminal domain-containing protein n=1 Tax=Actomonas aquatica TaxID=2866162 RepID=A0ABZ1C4G5_9BACT|nr:hypothetical protein [Opitutus sp. WL0086]WRQ86138.1 hypothetical protein K1X11_015085 [Opitutus sp. WL0086]
MPGKSPFPRIALLLAFIVAGSCALRATPPTAPSDGEISAAYHARSEQLINRYIERTQADNPEWGSLPWVAANFARGTNLEWARHRLRELTKEPSGAMFWMYPMVLVMKAGEPHLAPSDWAVIREAWRTYFPFRGDTENHWLMYYASLYLAAETWSDLPPEAWYNGKSSAENRAEAKEYILDWIKITTAYGRGEYDSPNYIDPYVSALGLLAGWCEDPELRQQATMMLEYELLDFAVENIGGVYGGAHSRIYPKHAMQPALGASSALAWLLWDQHELTLNGSALIVALSGWTPPPILQRIATYRDVPYEHRELKRTRWRMRHAGPDAFEIEDHMTTPVYKYSYVTPDYLLGSSQGGLLQPIQQQTWSLNWFEEKPLGIANTFFALHPHYSAKEGTMYFGAEWDDVVDLIARSKVDYTSPDKMMSGSPYEQVFQSKSALIGLYDIAPDAPFQHLNTFFSRDLAEVTEDDSGWIFAIGGPTYIAYRPFQPGEWRPSDWTGLLAGGAGAWISARHDEWGAGHRVRVSEYPKNGYVVQVAPVSAYASFADFQTAVKALPLDFATEPTPTVTFTSLDGTVLSGTYGERPLIDGEPLPYESWPLFDGPFAQAARESHQLEIRFGTERRELDFDASATTTRIVPLAP